MTLITVLLLFATNPQAEAKTVHGKGHRTVALPKLKIKQKKISQPVLMQNSVVVLKRPVKLHRTQQVQVVSNPIQKIVEQDYKED